MVRPGRGENHGGKAKKLLGGLKKEELDKTGQDIGERAHPRAEPNQLKSKHFNPRTPRGGATWIQSKDCNITKISIHIK